MPEEEKVTPITNRVAAVMAASPDNAPKDAENTFKHFRYASADSIYRTVRKALAEAGLSIWFSEVKFELKEMTKGGNWIFMEYEAGFSEDGKRPEVLERVTQACQFTGQESFGAIRTFAQKYWLRGKLLLSTGEPDLDADVGKEPPPKVDKPVPKKKDPVGVWSFKEGLLYCEGDSTPNLSLPTKRSMFTFLLNALQGDNVKDKQKACFVVRGEHPYYMELPDEAKKQLQAACDKAVPRSQGNGEQS